MLSGSPLEILFDLGSIAPLRHTLLGLTLLLIAALGWLYLRASVTRRRFGGAVVFLAVSFAAESVLPWLPPEWKLAMTLRAIALLTFLFGLVRALVIMADLVARRRQTDFSTIFRDLATLLVYGI